MRSTKEYIKDSFTEIDEKGCYCLQRTCTQKYTKHIADIPIRIADPLPILPTPNKKREFILENKRKESAKEWGITTQDITEQGELHLVASETEEWTIINPKESIPQSIYIPNCSNMYA